MNSSISNAVCNTVRDHPFAIHRDQLISEIFDWLHGLANVTDRQMREMEKLTGLNRNQALAIKAVSGSDCPCVSELARQLCFTPATMVRILDRLEVQGFVSRTRSKADRRVVQIGLTEQGRELEAILGCVTKNSLPYGMELTSDGDLTEILESLKKLSLLFDTVYHRSSPIRDVECLQGD